VIVIDASAAISLLINDEHGELVHARLRQDDAVLHAPHLVDLEVLQVLRRYFRSDRMNVSRADEALADFQMLPIRRHAHEAFLPRIWELRDSLTAYDAAYIALAEALDVPLLTTDRRLAASHGHDAEVELL